MCSFIVQWAALRRRALAVFVSEAVKARGLTLWQFYVAIDEDGNGVINPSELYGGLRFLEVGATVTSTERHHLQACSVISRTCCLMIFYKFVLVGSWRLS